MSEIVQGTKIGKPYSAEAEQAVIGALLIDGSAYKEIEWLQPGDFYIKRNEWIYSAIVRLANRGMAIDYLTVSEALEKSGHLKELGGPAYLMEVINRTPSSLHVEAYARIVKGHAADRKLLDVANKLTKLAYSGAGDKGAEIAAAIDELARVNGQGAQAVHWSLFLSQLYDEVQAATLNPVDFTGIRTGLLEWDLITGGLQRKTVTKLTGDPGLGKSVLAMQVLADAANPRIGNTPGVMYQLEMGAMQVVRRKVSSATDIATRAMRTGKISEDMIPAFIAGIEKLSQLPVYISDNSHLTTQDLRVDLYRLKQLEPNLGVVVIDFEGLLKDHAKDENDHSIRVSARVHDIAKDLDLAIISIGDMTKQGIKGEIDGQGALAGTGKELHNADDIMVMRQDAKNPRQIVVNWAKLREPESPGRTMFLIRRPGFPMFTNPPRV